MWHCEGGERKFPLIPISNEERFSENPDELESLFKLYNSLTWLLLEMKGWNASSLQFCVWPENSQINVHSYLVLFFGKCLLKVRWKDWHYSDVCVVNIRIIDWKQLAWLCPQVKKEPKSTSKAQLTINMLYLMLLLHFGFCKDETTIGTFYTHFMKSLK